jgi:hypothetical protein
MSKVDAITSALVSRALAEAAVAVQGSGEPWLVAGV